MKLLSFTLNGTPIPIKGVPQSPSFLAGNYIGTGISLLMLAAILLSLAYLIYAGFNYIISGGDKQKVDNARKGIVWAVVGLIVSLSAFIFLNVLTQVFGIHFVSQ